MCIKEAIRAACQKSAQECSASSGAMQMKAQDKQSLACKQAFRQLATKTVKPHSRQAWMHTSYNLEMMRAMVFSEAKALLQSKPEVG